MQQRKPPLAFAQVDLDSDAITPAYPIIHLLRLHAALKLARCSLPLFDLYCLAWKAKRAESAPLTRAEVAEFLGAPESASHIVGAFRDQVKDLAEEVAARSPERSCCSGRNHEPVEHHAKRIGVVSRTLLQQLENLAREHVVRVSFEVRDLPPLFQALSVGY
jgi:hypothetical protein